MSRPEGQAADAHDGPLGAQPQAGPLGAQAHGAQPHGAHAAAVPAAAVPAADAPAADARATEAPAADAPAADALDAEEPGARERETLRLQRANRATRGGLAALLCLEAFVALLVPRGIAQTPEGVSTTKTVLLIGLAVVLVACAFLLTRPWGIALGSILQLAVAATVLLVPALAVVVVIFLLLWLYLLRTRRIWLGTRRGWRMLVS